jgi:hypothetical protein
MSVTAGNRTRQGLTRRCTSNPEIIYVSVTIEAH